MCDEIRWFDAMWRHPNEMLHRVTALWIISTMWQSSRRSHNAPVSYPTMLHFVIEMCTCVHISLTKWSVVGYLCEALYDLWDGFIATTAYLLGPLLNMNVMIARFMGPTWGPVGPRWAPRWPHQLCYLDVVNASNTYLRKSEKPPKMKMTNGTFITPAQ